MAQRSDQKFDELIDIMADAPVLLEETDLLMCNTNYDYARTWGASILRSFYDILKKLQVWQQEVRVNANGPVYWAVPSTLTNPADADFDDVLFPFCLEFASLSTGILFNLSWGVMLQLYRNMMQLYAHISDNSANPPSLHDILHCGQASKSIPRSKESQDDFLENKERITMESLKAEADKLARYVLQCIEYFNRIEMGTFGSQSTCYTQWSVRRYCEVFGYSRELNWNLNIKNMHGPGSLCGIELMTFFE